MDTLRPNGFTSGGINSRGYKNLLSDQIHPCCGTVSGEKRNLLGRQCTTSFR